jgi:predicted SnoaL-like aldol condensation-catalyzing enzyme
MQQTNFEEMKQGESKRKNIALDFMNLIGQQKFKEGLRFFAPDCITHNPYIAGSMETLTDAMIAANNQMSTQYTEPSFKIKHVLADGDFVAIHTELLASKSKPGEGGLRQVHLFRFGGDKIVEYWDITQQIMANMPNAVGAF